MTTKRAKKVNQFYTMWASEHIVVDMSDKGELYCDVVSESDISKSYRVYVEESLVVPCSVFCTCEGFQHASTCKHAEIVDSYYARIYRSNLAKFIAKQEALQVAEKTIEPPVQEAVEISVAERKTTWDRDLCARVFIDTRELVIPRVYHAA